MKIYRSNQPIDTTFNSFLGSVFLAGPSPRNSETESWRPKAIDILKSLNYSGDVFAPEPFGGSFEFQLGWELRALQDVEVIVFWVPRYMPKMPGLTTNVEFGMFLNSGKIIYGRPDDAEHCSYLDWHYKRMTGKNPHNDLHELMKEVVSNQRRQ